MHRWESGQTLGPPHDDVLPFREMQQRLALLELNPSRFSHRISHKLGFGRLQRPGRMMNLAANELALAVERIEAVAFRQEIFERTWSRKNHRANRTVTPLQCRSDYAIVGPLTVVLDPAVSIPTAHPRAKVRQVKPRSRDGDGKRVTCVQAEEPH